MRGRFRLVFGILIACIAPCYAAMDTRIALVIGNDTYEGWPLDNAVSDARKIADALRDSKFDVRLLENANKDETLLALDTLTKQLKEGRGAAFIYYAGHGFEVDGRNYIIPVDEPIEFETRNGTNRINKDSSIEVDLVIDTLNKSGIDVKIVVLDACRDDPAQAKSRSIRRRGFLPPTVSPKGTFVAYSTAPGQVASDASGYAEYLATYLRKPGWPIEKVFRHVRTEVGKRTSGTQTPWDTSSLEGGDFFFNPGPVVAAIDNSAHPAPLPIKLQEPRTHNQLEKLKRAIETGAYASPPIHNAVFIASRLFRDPDLVDPGRALIHEEIELRLNNVRALCGSNRFDAGREIIKRLKRLEPVANDDDTLRIRHAYSLCEPTMAQKVTPSTISTDTSREPMTAPTPLIRNSSGLSHTQSENQQNRDSASQRAPVDNSTWKDIKEGFRLLWY